MYFARIVFGILNNQELKLNDREIKETMNLFENCTIKVENESESYKVIITYGLFSSEQEANLKGRRLFDSIKVNFI